MTFLSAALQNTKEASAAASCYLSEFLDKTGIMYNCIIMGNGKTTSAYVTS